MSLIRCFLLLSVFLAFARSRLSRKRNNPASLRLRGPSLRSYGFAPSLREAVYDKALHENNADPHATAADLKLSESGGAC